MMVLWVTHPLSRDPQHTPTQEVPEMSFNTTITMRSFSTMLSLSLSPSALITKSQTIEDDGTQPTRLMFRSGSR